MGKSIIEKTELNPNNLDDINKVIANCEVEIGNRPSLLINVFKTYFPDAKIYWNAGCTKFLINGIKYGMHLHYYWMNDAPRFYVDKY